MFSIFFGFSGARRRGFFPFLGDDIRSDVVLCLHLRAEPSSGSDLRGLLRGVLWACSEKSVATVQRTTNASRSHSCGTRQYRSCLVNTPKTLENPRNSLLVYMQEPAVGNLRALKN